MGKKDTKNRNKKNGGHLQFRKSIRVKNRAKDLDQIQDEIKQHQKDPTKPRPIDLDLPGAGQYYCLSCARYFISSTTLNEHIKSKVHKKKLKLADEPQYTQAEADAAAGMAPPK